MYTIALVSTDLTINPGVTGFLPFIVFDGQVVQRVKHLQESMTSTLSSQPKSLGIGRASWHSKVLRLSIAPFMN